MKFSTIPAADLERLAAEYDETFNSDLGYDIAVAGGEDPKLLCLGNGDTYSTVDWSPLRGYHWNHDNVVSHDDNDGRSDLMQDLADHGSHERY